MTLRDSDALADACDLDPLGVGVMLLDVREMNTTADVNALMTLLRRLVPAEGFVAGLTAPECVATMRDLGLLLGSLKRHGVEPVDAVPGIEAALLELGARTGMVPRDTVYHYTEWNPAGPWERLYTGDHMERLLISSMRATLPRLRLALEQCRRLCSLEPDDLEFAVNAQELVSLVRSLEDAVDNTVANVSPTFFARTLRPYFEAVRVGGEDHLGPAAAHAPLYLIDLVLWASDHGDAEYTKLSRESARYGLPHWGSLYEQWANGPSLVTRLTSALSRPGEVSPELSASTEAVCRALRALVAFRGKHLGLARKAYAQEIRRYSLGSGGGTVALLEHLTALTRENMRSLRQGHSPHRSSSAPLPSGLGLAPREAAAG